MLVLAVATASPAATDTTMLPRPDTGRNDSSYRLDSRLATSMYNASRLSTPVVAAKFPPTSATVSARAAPSASGLSMAMAYSPIPASFIAAVASARSALLTVSSPSASTTMYGLPAPGRSTSSAAVTRPSHRAVSPPETRPRTSARAAARSLPGSLCTVTVSPKLTTPTLALSGSRLMNDAAADLAASSAPPCMLPDVSRTTTTSTSEVSGRTSKSCNRPSTSTPKFCRTGTSSPIEAGMAISTATVPPPSSVTLRTCISFSDPALPESVLASAGRAGLRIRPTTANNSRPRRFIV